MNFKAAFGPVIFALAGILATLAIMLWPAHDGDPTSQTRPHLLLALSFVVVAAPIFTFGWSARRKNSLRTVLASTLIAASAVLIVAQALFLPGMPGLGGSETLTSTFELAAQAVFSLALLITGIPLPILPDGKRHRYAVLALVAAATAAFMWLAPVFDPRLSPGSLAEKSLQYVVAAIDMAALIFIWQRLRREPGPVFQYLAAAAFITMLAQLLAAHGDDRAHLGSHAYVLLAALCTCRSLYLRAIDAPYALLEAARRELESNCEQFRSKTELSQDWYWEQDRDLRFTLLTKLVDPMSAPISENLLRGKTRWELPHLKASAEQWQAHKAVLEAHQPFGDFEFIDDQQDQPLRFLSTSGKPVFSADGTFTGYRGITKDITARKQTEFLLATVTQLLEMISAGHALESILSVLCHETEQVLRRETVAVLSYAENPARLRVIATPRLPDDLRQMFEAAAATPECWPKGDTAHSQEAVVVRNLDDSADPARFNEKLRDAGFVASWTLPIVSRESTLGYLTLYFTHQPFLANHDRQFLGRITQLAAIAIERSKSEESMRLAAIAYENAREGIMIIDANYKIISVNAAYTRITGRSADEIIGQEAPSFSKGLHGSAFYRSLMETVVEKGHWSGEYWERHENGGLYYKWVSIVALKDSAGRITHYAAITADMSEQKEAELRLRLRHNITEALSNVGTMTEAISDSLALICKMHDWDFGACWRPTDNNRALECAACWAAPHRKLEQFSEQAGTARIVLGDAGAVPGQRDRLDDLARNPGYPAKSASTAGLREILTLPVVIEGELIAILEFRNKLPRAVEPRVIEMIHSLGNQIGTFLVKQRTEKLLREQETELRQITDNIPASIVHLDSALRIKFANRVYAERRGLPVEMLIGRNVADVYDFEGNPDVLDYCQQVLDGREISFLKEQAMPGGGPRVTRATMLPERGPDGTVIGIFSIGVDITRQFKAESDIRSLNRHLEQQVKERQLQNSILKTQLETTLDAILLVDENADIILYNRKFVDMFGIPEELLAARTGRVVTKAFADLMVDPESCLAIMRHLFNARGEKSMDKFRFKDGRIIDSYSAPVVSEQGFYYGRVWHLHDITEQVTAEQEILALNQELEQRVRERTQVLEAVVKELEAFSYSVSHDLRAPLRGIDGFTRLLEQRYADRLDDTGRGYLARVRRGSARMSEIIDDMLSLSQVARGDFSATDVDLSEISHAILSDFMLSNPERRVTLDIENGITVQGDRRLLRITLENLLGNAWKFTAKRDHARISVGIEATPHGRAVFVRDNGAGFDMRYADKMFQSFQRLHSSTEFEGTGVGLAIVQRAINRHGGKIWAEGAVGVGATIYFIV